MIILFWLKHQNCIILVSQLQHYALHFQIKWVRFGPQARVWHLCSIRFSLKWKNTYLHQMSGCTRWRQWVPLGPGSPSPGSRHACWSVNCNTQTHNICRTTESLEFSLYNWTQLFSERVCLRGATHTYMLYVCFMLQSIKLLHLWPAASSSTLMPLCWAYVASRHFL